MFRLSFPRITALKQIGRRDRRLGDGLKLGQCILKGYCQGYVSVTLVAMPENEMDPAASTQQFRAFAQAGQAEDSGSRVNLSLIVAAVAALVAIVAVIAVVSLS